MPEISEMLARPAPRWLQSNNDQGTEWLAKGMAMGQRQQQLDEQRREALVYEQRLQEIHEFDKQAKNQDYELKKVRLQNELQERQEIIDSAGAYSKIARIYADHKINGLAGTEASEARIYSAIANQPSFYRHPGATNLLSEMKLSRSDREKADLSEQATLFKAATAGMTEAARTERAGMTVSGRKTVAEIRAASDLSLAKSKVILPKLSDVDRLTMMSELREAESMIDEDALPKIAEIHQRYEAKVNGAPLPGRPQASLPVQEPGTQPDLEPGGTMLNKPIFRNAPSDMVSVISPDGRRGKIPRDKLDAALQAGFKEAP